MGRQVVARAMREAGAGPTIGYRRGAGHDQPRGLGADDPGLLRRAADGRGVVGRRRRPGHHAGRRADRDGRRGHAGARVHRPVRRGDRAPTRSTTEPAASWAVRTLSSDASSGVEVGILEGYSAVVGSGAAIRIEFDDPADWQWAIDMWKSLAPG